MPVAISGALCSCSFGITPSSLVILPNNMVFVGVIPTASAADIIPMTNVMPFGMCSSMANPTVSAATAAATAANAGIFTLTPMPCVPVIVTPWIAKKITVLLPTGPILSIGDTCNCIWGGVVTILMPGQATVL